MDGFSAYCFLILLVCAASGKPMVEDGGETPASEQYVAEVSSSSSPAPTTTENVDVAESPQNCTTARNDSGLCIARASCEYSTAAIDFTLYAPHGYVKICKTDEVCCPLEFLALHKETIDISPPSNNDNDDAFEFDDDD